MSASFQDLLSAIRRTAESHVTELLGALLDRQSLGQLTGGKLLRSRLGARLACCPDSQVAQEDAVRACAAVELVHTASLCHDDVIDGGLLRRGQPALHTKLGPRRAILVGDMLLAAAFELISETGADLTKSFAAHVREVAAAEADQELLMLGQPAGEEACLHRARALTGPLFAFVAMACAGPEPALRDAAREAGYRIGTAYQLADDLLDVRGEHGAASKTLGTDASRGRPTLAALPVERLAGHVSDLCGSAIDLLVDWAGGRGAAVDFLRMDLAPVLDRHVPELAAALRQACPDSAAQPPGTLQP